MQARKKREASPGKESHNPPISLQAQTQKGTPMLSPNGISGNGHVTHLVCESDYEDVPYTPALPAKPDWTGQLSVYTHNLSWMDADQCQHSLTIRADDLQTLLSDLKLIKEGIRRAKQKAADAKPEASDGQTQPERVVCKIHGIEMERRVSKRTGGHYHCHRLGNDLCFGWEKK